MNAITTPAQTIDPHARLVEPTTLRIERLLPGPIERCWAYLTDSDLRRQWLAAGAMDLTPGAAFTFTWRNDELTDPPGARPEGFGAEHSMASRVIAAEPPHRLEIAWGEGSVRFELAPAGDRVLLMLTHTRIVERDLRLKIGAGWHAHLDVMAAKLGGADVPPFWDHWRALRDAYDRRMPA